MEKIKQMRDEEWIECLHDLCRKLLTPESVVVEIGSFGGESTQVFAKHARKVYAVDPWSPDYEGEILLGCEAQWIIDYVSTHGVEDMAVIEMLFDARTRDLANVCKIKRRGADALSLFEPQSVDLVYIDSIHTKEEVSRLISQWWPKIKIGGMCAGHDYCIHDWPGVVAAVDEAFGRPKFVFGDTSWAVRVEAIPSNGPVHAR